MRRRAAMTDVELVDDDGTDVTVGRAGARGSGGRGAHERGPHDPSPPPTTAAPDPRRRRALVAGGVTLVLVVAAAAVAQGVGAARERTRLAALAGTPGVVDLLDGPPEVLWGGDDPGVLQATARTPGGLLVSARTEEDGTSIARAVDASGGAPAWEVPLIDGTETGTPPEGAVAWPSEATCAGYGADADRVVCLAHNGLRVAGSGAPTSVPATVARLLVLDSDEGSVVHDLSPALDDGPTPDSLIVLDDLVVLAAVDETTAYVQAVASDGSTAWRTTFPSSAGLYGAYVQVTVLGELAVVMTPTSVALLDAMGAVAGRADLRSDEYVVGTTPDAVLIRTGPDRTVVRGTGADVVTAGESTKIVTTDGVRRVPGQWIGTRADDGSVPGLVVTQNVDGTHAWTTDGAPLWTSGLRAGPTALVLDGRLFLSVGATLVALDARTGAELWRADGFLPESGLTTDGRHLVVLAPDEGRSAPRNLVGVEPADGRVAWRVTMPATVDGLGAVLGVLTGYLDDVTGTGEPHVVVLG